MKSFTEKVKPILYDQNKLLDLSKDLKTHLNNFLKVDKFDTSILNSVNSIIRVLKEIEQCAEYLSSNVIFI